MTLTWFLIVVALVALALLLLVSTARRRDTDSARGVLSSETVKRDRKAVNVLRKGGRRGRPTRQARPVGTAVEETKRVEPVKWTPPDPEAVGVARRQFLNRGIVGSFVLGLSGFGAAVLAFLWPSAAGGFGSDIRVGKVGDVIKEVRANNGFLYNAEGRMWVTEYAGNLDKARASYSQPELNGMEQGLVALYQKCPHLGCRVPECVTSQWFECPCHGSQYNRVGEKKGGPAPRGMDRFAMEVGADGVFVVKTGTIINGPPIGTNTTGQEAEGPHCIGAADGH